MNFLLFTQAALTGVCIGLAYMHPTEYSVGLTGFLILWHLQAIKNSP